MRSETRPLLVFHDIPETAGAPFRTALFNLFGEANCAHLREIDLRSGEDVRSAITRGERPRMVCGHIPMRYVPEDSRDAAATFVRDPIDRVLSLYRFMRDRPLAVRAHLGLGETFTLREFLDCRHSEVTAQVDDGMCRFLAREHSYWPIDYAAGAPRKPDAMTLYSAQDALGGMIVGVCERMRESLALLSAAFGLGAPLSVVDENPERVRREEAAGDELAEIAARNANDIALYRHALARFEHEVRFGPRHVSALITPETLSPGREYRIDCLPGRDGFNPFEEQPQVSWLSHRATARLHFLVGAEPVHGLSMRIYAGQDDYPVESAAFLLNGAAPPLAWRPDGDHWGTVFLGPFQTVHGLNTLEICTPAPDGAATPAFDPRPLAFGVSSIRAN
ncbi:MAG: hypothetical protein ACREH4_00320 [Vitreimonas sp.]